MSKFAIMDNTGIIEENSEDYILDLWEKLSNFYSDRDEVLGVEINGNLRLVEIKDYLA
jgi:aryl-phospho-beta-D-glucosidase BglC (GH1 family)